MSKNGKVISIISMKGGAGKAVLSIGISSFLSEKKDEKVPLIDNDPQFNATWTSIDPEGYLKSEETIFKLSKPQTELRQSFAMPKREELVIKIDKNLDILMDDLDLVLINKSSDSGLIERLKRFITRNNLRDYYDYIIIDCPPTLMLYTDSALASSDYYLIPNRMGRYLNIGISSLSRATGDLIDQEDLELKRLGLIYMTVQNHLSDKQKEVKTKLGSNKTTESIYVFKFSISLMDDMQVGERGPIATRCVKSNKNISDVVDELQILLSKDSSEEGVTVDG